MLNKKEKGEVIDSAIADIAKARSIVFIDFTGVKTGDLNAFRKSVRTVGGKMTVIKKKLLRVAFEKAGIDMDPEIFESQVGTIISSEELYIVAAPAYKFAAAKILGGYDLDAKRFVSAEEVELLGKLPSREVLISQVVGMVAAPLRSFMYVLKERANKIA
ncbi:MAG: 50S ribosomal protein L10 [Candidatus Colwellbacteria bacterium]|nr:50S ribosomal protein L10 [Candidatus Colwellbacteria bacterium]